MAAANKNLAEVASTDRDVAEIGGKTRPIDQFSPQFTGSASACGEPRRQPFYHSRNYTSFAFETLFFAFNSHSTSTLTALSRHTPLVHENGRDVGVRPL